MATSLTPSSSPKEDFTGPVGNVVTVKLKGPSGAGAKIVHIRYANDEIDTTPPLEFKLKAGAKIFVVLVEASKPGALVQVIEDGGGSEQVLDRFHFDPMNPARGYIIRGV